MKSSITVLFKFRFPFVRVPYPELPLLGSCTDEGELWKAWRMKQSDYAQNLQSFVKTHSTPLSGLFDVDAFAEFSLSNCFCLLSCLVHRCALSPHRDAGGLRCIIRESWAGSCSSSTKTISSVKDKPTFIALPKRANRRPYRWGAENSALPNMCSGDLCEFY